MKNIDSSIRLATVDDIEAMEKMMKRSMKELGKGYYTEKQIDSCCQFVCVPDRQVIEDQTFFVAVSTHGTIIGCGGWSFRNKLHAGPKTDDSKNEKINPSVDSARIRAMFIDPSYSRRGIGAAILDLSIAEAKKYGFSKGTLGATLSGLEFYKSRGWTSLDEEEAQLPDGTLIRVVTMEKFFK